MKAFKFYRVLVVLFVLSFTANGAFASNFHNYHTSLTRIDYNAKDKLFEISIQLFIHDLQPLLEKRKGSRIDLEKTPDVDKLLLGYLNENVVLTDRNGKAKQLKWVGKEIDIDSVWVYLESPTEESLPGYNLQNTLFFESFPEQTNLVVCRFDEKKLDLMFKAGDKVKEISVENPKPEN
jgi:hypothetical protein